MKGDFSRSSFQRAKHYTGVRMQQGRVQLDADWNEQIDILGHQIRTPLTDILGARAVPAASVDGSTPLGFEIQLPSSNGTAREQSGGGYPLLPDFTIGPGRCYVNGLLCENESAIPYSAQPDFPGAAAELAGVRDAGYTDLLVYLDAWVRHITALEDPELREPALAGPDTTTRTKLVWQIRLAQYSAPADGMSHQSEPAPPGTLNVKLAPGRMRENQLYRVEVQRVVEKQGDEPAHLFFKWSRENASVAYAIASIKEAATDADAVSTDGPSSTATESIQNEDDSSGLNDMAVMVDEERLFLIRLLDHDPSSLYLAVGDWVEFVSDPITLGNSPQPLLQVTDVQVDTGEITVRTKADGFFFDLGHGASAGVPEAAALTANHAYLRRWDQRDLSADNVEGCVRVQAPNPGQAEQTPLESFVPLENGLSVQFDFETSYSPGDFWMIPARVQFSKDDLGLLWPRDSQGDYLPQPPQGDERRSAPLARLQLEDGSWTVKPWTTCYDEHVDYQVCTDAESEPVWDGYRYTYCSDHIVKPLPQLTANLADVNSRLKSVEVEVENLRERVAELEEKMKDVLAWMQIERTMLFEDFYSEEQLVAGEVVALHPHRHDYIVRADTHQERVFLGVVTDFPMEYYADPSRYRVAMSGRATCRVVGTVKPGALLVPSNYPGLALAAGLFIRPGTVIGRALTGFTPAGSDEIGEVAVLITMG